MSHIDASRQREDGAASVSIVQSDKLPAEPKLQKQQQHSCPVRPQTSQGENGRPKGEPEAFSDYSMIYDIIAEREKKRRQSMLQQKQVNHQQLQELIAMEQQSKSANKRRNKSLKEKKNKEQPSRKGPSNKDAKHTMEYSQISQSVQSGVSHHHVQEEEK